MKRIQIQYPYLKSVLKNQAMFTARDGYIHIYQHSFRATIDDEGRTLFLWRTCLWNSVLMSLVFNRSRCRESGISLWNTIRSQRKSVSNNGAVCYAFTPTLRFCYEEFGMQAVKRAMQPEIVQNMSYHWWWYMVTRDWQVRVMITENEAGNMDDEWQ